ncbi:hypothetical protein VTK73DRAFT_1133 [Phialemonium thermophilum]|uniref:Uncharacterized protein n=1 Tax=Phialemonium thermophilum TaxID=223376 RepID=A0ABR3XAT3_9PEZI
MDVRQTTGCNLKTHPAEAGDRLANPDYVGKGDKVRQPGSNTPSGRSLKICWKEVTQFLGSCKSPYFAISDECRAPAVGIRNSCHYTSIGKPFCPRAPPLGCQKRADFVLTSYTPSPVISPRHSASIYSPLLELKARQVIWLASWVSCRGRGLGIEQQTDNKWQLC